MRVHKFTHPLFITSFAITKSTASKSKKRAINAKRAKGATENAHKAGAKKTKRAERNKLTYTHRHTIAHKQRIIYTICIKHEEPINISNHHSFPRKY